MKVLYVNGADIEGGAARAATLLLQGTHAQGIDAHLYVQRKHGVDTLVSSPSSMASKALGRIRPTLEQFLFGITPGKTNSPFCAAFLPDGLKAQVDKMTPDLIHLHWVARMMRLETLRHLTKPIIWTMHDSWAFTGGCYLPGNCTRYRESCGKCPVLDSPKEDDLSHQIWKRKNKAWDGLNLTIVAPSRWMAECAKASSLFCNSRIEVIHNGIDVNTYKPLEKGTVRDSLNLPQDKNLILFGALNFTKDRNKGFHLLVQALHELAGSKSLDSIELVTFGSKESPSIPELSIKVWNTGYVSDENRLAQLYSAADVFVLPSINESLGYTVMEAMACGTPCVAFDQGGVPDLIDHEQNGFLARPYEPDDLARGIAWILEDTERWEILSKQARHKVERNFPVGKIAERHLELYREILEKWKMG